MKRSTVYLSSFVSMLAVWAALLLHREHFSPEQYHMITALPFFLLIALGSYCLFALGRGLMFFNDCPQEIPKLEQDIREAKADLNKKGFNLAVDK